MLDNKFQKFLFHLTSVATNISPKGGAWFFNHAIPPLLGNRLLVSRTHQKNLAGLRKVPKFERILVIPDVHIGDAIMMQAAVSAFRDFFPKARVDYVIKKSIACLMEGNPDVSNLYPVFTGAPYPNEADVAAVKKLVAENGYDLCFNCSPFFEDASLFPPGQAILNFMTVAPQMIRNDLDQTGINHFLFQSYEFPHQLLSQIAAPVRTDPFKGVPLTLSDQAYEAAEEFLKSAGPRKNQPILFLNPDTASPYTRIPFEQQLELLKGFTRTGGLVLLGAAFTAKGIEDQLMAALTAPEREMVKIVPTALPIDAYSALIDFTDVFLSGDTGPLHMAAARKVSKSGQKKFRNKTFVLSVFGATPARMSGYDSTDPLFPAAYQDVLSKTYVSQSPCRNITCVNKMAKTCRTIRCFASLDVKGILGDVENYLAGLKA
ncbi:MAG TPA: glycosyltransferase family 9 protein [bacterium]|nr:glycosyltransferase family 9 protein [bacterium]